MNYDQNNAGIHLIPRGYKGRSDTIQPMDKYAEMIATAHMAGRKKDNKDNEIIKNIENCNFIIFMSKRGQRKKCLCGGELHYKDKVVIKFRDGDIMKSIEMAGKQCVDCERKVLVKSEVLEKVKQELYKPELFMSI